MVEIERLVTGDLNKSIEQCVTLLMDVERKVHVLKNELAQTLNQLPNQRVAGVGFPSLPFQGYAPGVPVTGAAPFAGIPQTTGFGAPEGTIAPRMAPLPFVHGAWTPWTTGWNYGLPQGAGNYGLPAASPLPYQAVPFGVGAMPGFPPTIAPGYAPGYAPSYAPSYAPGFTPLPQGLAPVSPVTGYGYIW